MARSVFVCDGSSLRALVVPITLLAAVPIDYAYGINIIYEYDDEGENPAWDADGQILLTMFEAAALYWEPIFPYFDTYTLQIEWDDDISGLGLWTDTPGDNGIEINPTHAWWVDPTPWASEEFNFIAPAGGGIFTPPTYYQDLSTTEQNDWFNGPVPGALEVGYGADALASSGAVGNHDLLSVMIHELGHELGINSVSDQQYDLYAHHVGGATGVQVEAGPGGHIAPTTTLMYESIGKDMRVLPSAADILVIANERSFTEVQMPRTEFLNVNNNFSDPLNWIGGLPVAATSATVRNGATVNATASVNMVFRELTVMEGSYVSTGANTLDVSETLTIDGTPTGGYSARLTGNAGGVIAANILRSVNGGQLYTQAGSTLRINQLEGFSGVFQVAGNFQVGHLASGSGGTIQFGGGSPATSLEVGQTTTIGGVDSSAWGQIDIATGGTANTATVRVAGPAFSWGRAYVSFGGRWDINGSLIVGGAGEGSDALVGIVNGGGMNVLGTAIIDRGPTGTQALLEVRTNGQFSATNSIVVGNYGSGRLDVYSGSVLDADLFIGRYAGSSGQVTVGGTGSRLTSSSGIYVGGELNNVGGTGTLTVEYGGVVSATGTITVWGGSTVALSGGSSSIRAESFVVQSGGTFRHEDGTLTVDGGTFVSGMDNYTLAGADISGLPTVELVNGALATLSLVGTSTKIGDSNSGHLKVLDGSSVTAFGELFLAYHGTAYGKVTVSGNSTLNVTGDLEVGDGGDGNLTIEQGGLVNSRIGAGNLGRDVIGDDLGTASGDVIVRNPGSLWRTDNLHVGDQAFGVLAISDGGAVVTAGDAFIARYIGSDDSFVNVQGANSRWDVSGSLFVGGELNSSGGRGRLIVGSGASVTAADLVKSWGSSTISLNDATIQARYIELSDGATLEGSGSMDVGDELFSRGTIRPGLSLGTLEITSGDYWQYVDGILEIELGGTERHDRLVVAGSAALGGTLNVSLLTGFTPSVGDTFQILTASGGVSGRFNSQSMPVLGGNRALRTFYTNDAVTLAVMPERAGDYNFNGAVDGPDYFVWRSQLGQTAVGLAADGDIDADGDGDDFDVWETNLDPGSTIQVLFSEDFYGAAPGTYGGQIPGSQFQVVGANVDVVGVRNGSFFTCARVASGNCLDLVGNSGAGAITSVPTFDLTAGTTYFLDVGADLQGFADTDPAQSQFTVALGSLSQTLTAIAAGEDYRLAFTPLTDEAGARLTFTTNDAPDFVHGAVLDHIVLFTWNLLGDYNGDGVVNAADYTVWRDTLGQAVPPFTGADGDGDSVIDQDDYDIWKSNYGMMAGSGALANSPNSSARIPEPPVLSLAVLAGIALALRRPNSLQQQRK